MSKLAYTVSCTMLLLTACASAPRASFQPTAFVSAERDFGVRYAEPGRSQVLSRDWRVTNFELDSEGRPAKSKFRGSYESKLDWTYGDGSSGPVTTSTHELVLSHQSEATIWIRVLPLPGELRSKTHRVLAERWVNDLSGSVYEYYLGGRADEKRVATKILSSEPVKLAGKSAHAVVFDAVNVDQLQLDPNAPRTRVKVVVRAGNVQKTLLRSGDPIIVPGVLLIGYSNGADHFDSLLPQFDDVVQRVQFYDRER